MQFMLIMTSERNMKPDPSVFAEMGKFVGELAAGGKLRGGAPLHAEGEGARVRANAGKPLVTDGPFTETKEVVGGFFLVECADKSEAVSIASRCPHARVGLVEVRQVMQMGGPLA
jgi:hypothetical protein